jgi:serine O-acetyltransferase
MTARRDTDNATADLAAHPRALGPRPPLGLREIVRALRVARDETPVRHPGRLCEIPTRDSVAAILEGARTVLFPSHFGGTELDEETLEFFVGSTLHRTLSVLHEEARRALAFASDSLTQDEDLLSSRADAFVSAVGAALPELRRVAVADLEAAREVDDSGAPPSELLVCDPGMRALLTHRFAHVLHRAGVPLLPRLAAEVARDETGIYLSPAAHIGPRVAILGAIVIRAGSIIPANVVLEAGVSSTTLAVCPLPSASTEDATIELSQSA